jgi:hypothetical protein
VCWTHGGAISRVKRKAAERVGIAEALSVWRAVPGEIEVGPAEAVLGMLQAAGAAGGGSGASGAGAVVSVEAAALAALEAQERDRCVHYAKTAHGMGIAERGSG